MMATAALFDGDIPAEDWQGQPITDASCRSCPHAALRAEGGCEPGRSCMQDVYARRIDRFFHAHPGLANAQLAHPYFEVRAIAARHADLFRLTPLLDDPDETVRMQLALRLPQRQLMKLRADPHREVRIRVALRIDEAELAPMALDSDYQVRCIAARRLPESALWRLMHDADLQVRLEVVRRLSMPALWRMADDEAHEVRRLVAQRVPEEAAALLDILAADPHWLVRWEVAGRAQGATLQRLMDDAEAEVRAQARERRAPTLPFIARQEPAHG